MGGEILIELIGVTRDYRALRPLRIQSLHVHAGETVALVGLDAAMAEVLVNLITGAQLPDAGEVRVFGRPTDAVTDVDEWVGDLDRFGLISERAVLVEQLTVEQNLALPLSLEIDELPPTLRQQVRQIASEVVLTDDDLVRPTAELGAEARLRLRLGRALALTPRVLLAEHPTATLDRGATPRFAADFARISAARGLASLVVTADATFASAVADRVLTLQPATGLLRATEGWRRWFPFRNGT